MTKHEIIQYLTNYLTSHNIQHTTAIADGLMTLCMVFPAPEAPDKYVESCIFFYDNDMEARTYYSATGAVWCKKSAHLTELYRLLNFINARLFLSCADGCGGALYHPNILYTPRFYLTEDDGYDISLTTIIPYEFFELAPLETADYLTGYSSELLNDLSAPIYLLLLGKIDVSESIQQIKKDIMTKPER